MTKDYYPTPNKVLDQMLLGVQFDEINTILEPSAGKGDICDYIRERRNRRSDDLSIDVVEIDTDLQKILQGKKYNLVYDDFLSFQTSKKYDLIVANFPFSDGDEHLQKALQLQEQYGGSLICLVNAETIKNPYSNLRKTLVTKLEKYGAEIKYLQDMFIDAERTTGVEVALIKVMIEKKGEDSLILDNLKAALEFNGAKNNLDEALIDRDPINALISRFDLENKVGISLISEYRMLQKFMLASLNKGDNRYETPIIKLEIRESTYGDNFENDYLKQLRLKYWKALLSSDFSSKYTSNIQKELQEKLNSLAGYDFNLFNIRKLEESLSENIVAGIEKAILTLFDEFVSRYSYSDDIMNGNIHYYNGWKSNKAHKINSKVVLPVNGFSSYSFSSKDKLDNHYVREKILDMTKVFNYLSTEKVTLGSVVSGSIERANDLQSFRNIDFHYFTATFYKKGTCHITFTNKALLDKFNIFGSQRKGWLPPSYGKRSYSDMSQEERSVVDEFQGEEEYHHVFSNRSEYIVENSKLLLEEVSL